MSLSTQFDAWQLDKARNNSTQLQTHHQRISNWVNQLQAIEPSIQDPSGPKRKPQHNCQKYQKMIKHHQHQKDDKKHTHTHGCLIGMWNVDEWCTSSTFKSIPTLLWHPLDVTPLNWCILNQVVTSNRVTVVDHDTYHISTCSPWR